MAFELPDGKTARTLPEQVKFLTEKLKDLYTAFNELGIKKIEIVESLPETGQEGILYMVPVEDPDSGNYYEEYIWLDSQWEMIGTTQIDLSGYVTTDTEQIISAIKTFAAKIIFDVDNNIQFLTVGNFRFEKDGNGKIILGQSNNDIRFYDSNIRVNSPLLRPQTTNYTDLGSNDHRYKDLHLSDYIELKNPDAAQYWRIYVDNAQNIIIQRSTNRTTWVNVAFWNANGVLNLLSNSLYLNGTINDTGGNSVSVADLAALITYAKAQGWIS